jgi:hypothetical protein
LIDKIDILKKMGEIRLVIVFFIIIIQLNFIELQAQTWNIGYPDTTKVTATLTGDTLLIRGSGEMKNYPKNKTWHDRIVYVHIENGVTNIGHFAFNRCYQLKSVSISESVKSIGESAFEDCSKLKDVVIPNSVTLIKGNAFKGCKSLDSIIIPNSVLRIDMYAFYECFNLKKVLLESGVLNQIGENAFRACHNLSTITIPKSLTKIGDVAFRECYNLERIEVELGNLRYFSIDGVLFNKGQDTLISYPNGRKGEYIIPQSISVIGNSAFACSKINSVSIPSTVKVIEGDAFRYCDNLKRIIIPNSVSKIGVLAFADCDSLVSITLGNGITDINMYIVSQSNSLLEINVDNNDLRLSSNNGVLYNKLQDTLIMYPRGKKGKFVVPENVKFIKKGAFEACEGLSEIIISETVTTIEDLAFQYDRNLKIVTNMSTTPQTISEEVFSYVKLEKLCLYVPKNVIDKYKNTKVWKDFGEIKPIE